MFSYNAQEQTNSNKLEIVLITVMCENQLIKNWVLISLIAITEFLGSQQVSPCKLLPCKIFASWTLLEIQLQYLETLKLNGSICGLWLTERCSM